MVRSMTGFGRGQFESALYVVRVELRAVNNRNMKVVLRVPERLLALEARVEKVVREYAHRGTVQVAASLDELTGETGYIVDEATIAAYHRQLTQLQERLHIRGEVGLDVLVGLPGVVRKSKEYEDIPAALWEITEKALRDACAEMVHMREEEGAFLWKDILERGAAVGRMLEDVEARVPRMLEEYRERLAHRLGQLLSGMGDQLRPEEIHREIAIFTDRSDISEEIHRMRSHLAQLREVPGNGDPVGRKLEFIIQEMFREANTMGSKANDSKMIHDIVTIKSEIERLREQVFNVE